MEFINRIDEIVVFNPLGEKEIGKIVELKVATVAKQMKAKDMALQLEESARALLASKGFSREFGARFLQRAIHKELSNPLSDLVLKGTAKRGDTVVVKVAGDSLNFEIKPSTS
jgi:ATP-dependent Clp protease ATP-binding subunit ClpA